MDSSAPFNNYNVKEGKSIFTTASETQATSTESFTSTAEMAGSCIFSPMAAPFQTRMGNDMMTMMSQHEPRQADPAPSAADIENVLMNLGSDLLYDQPEQANTQNYFMGGPRADSVPSPASNVWAESPAASGARNGEIDVFDFLIKSVSFANNYLSMLTREQQNVLRCIRPRLLYEFLQEIAKVRGGDKRMRRALPNECAFCKNNGENEECYASHALKDWRGRVLCPVLRAFRCPRCGATGDRAHTIKYCPENVEGDLERSLSSRRRMAAAPLLVTRASPGPATPGASAPTTPLSHSSLWSNFSI